MNSSLKQRKMIIQLHESGLTAPAIASQVGLSVWTVRKWISRQKKTKVWVQRLVAQVQVA